MSIDWSKVDWYSRSRGSVASGPTVEISKGGRIVLNEEALSLFGGVPERINVGVVKGVRGKVTLVLQTAHESDSMSLTLGKQGKKYALNTKKFFVDRGLENLFGTVETSNLDYDTEHNAIIVNV